MFLREILPQTLMGASNSKRMGWLRKTSLATTQSWRISFSLICILFPLHFLPSNSLSIKPSNPSIPTSILFFFRFLHLIFIPSPSIILFASIRRPTCAKLETKKGSNSLFGLEEKKEEKKRRGFVWQRRNRRNEGKEDEDIFGK